MLQVRSEEQGPSNENGLSRFNTCSAKHRMFSLAATMRVAYVSPEVLHSPFSLAPHNCISRRRLGGISVQGCGGDQPSDLFLREAIGVDGQVIEQRIGQVPAKVFPDVTFPTSVLASDEQ